MTGQLHEISAAIGGLQAQAQEHQRQTEAIFNSLKELGNILSLVPVIKQTVEEIEPIVRALETDRNERNGRVGLISGAVGVFGASLVELVLYIGRKIGISG